MNIDNILKLVKELPISEVIGRDLVLKKIGQSHQGICPFHGDSSLGSFVVTDGKGIFKCFSCGVGGDSISYFSKLNNISYAESAINIAREFELISEDEANSYSGAKLSFSKKAFVSVENSATLQPVEIRDMVYRLFSQSARHLRKERLSTEHKEALLARGITDVEKSGYFTMPTRYIMPYLLKELNKLGFQPSILAGVPGFFYSDKFGEWSFAQSKVSGIGIPLKNESGQIVAIQIRKDTIGEGEQRYVFFSSSFATGSNGTSQGSSSGSPLDVVYPDDIKTKTLFVTEGHFKAEAIAEKFGAIAVSVQGVCAWANLLECIKSIKSERPEVVIDYVYVAYDGDLVYNVNVFTQAVLMGIHLAGIPDDMENELGIKLFYCLWDCDLGKGIDDLIQAQAYQSILKVEVIDMLKIYKSYLSKEAQRASKEAKKELFWDVLSSYQNK